MDDFAVNRDLGPSVGSTKDFRQLQIECFPRTRKGTPSTVLCSSITIGAVGIALRLPGNTTNLALSPIAKSPAAACLTALPDARRTLRPHSPLSDNAHPVKP